MAIPNLQGILKPVTVVAPRWGGVVDLPAPHPSPFGLFLSIHPVPGSLN